MKLAIDKLGAYAYKTGKDFSIVFEEMLDFFIETFDIDRVIRHKFNYSALLAEREQDNPDMFELLVRWLELATQGINKNGAYDFFGTMYEEAVKGKFKSSAMGQFFTPLELCQVMAELTYSPEMQTVNDCACGSGRTLLAHFMKSDKTKFYYYYAEDLDPICVKMCALNFMIHGMLGQVVHHDALMQDYLGAYEVNEIKWPIPTPCCSIRKISEEEYWHRRNELTKRSLAKEPVDLTQEAEKVVEPSLPSAPKQMSLFNF